MSNLAALAEHHERQGILHARQAMNDASWYHARERDTRRAAEHFAVAAALRAKGSHNHDD